MPEERAEPPPPGPEIERKRHDNNGSRSLAISTDSASFSFPGGFSYYARVCGRAAISLGCARRRVFAGAKKVGTRKVGARNDVSERCCHSSTDSAGDDRRADAVAASHTPRSADAGTHRGAAASAALYGVGQFLSDLRYCAWDGVLHRPSHSAVSLHHYGWPPCPSSGSRNSHIARRWLWMAM